MKQKYECRTLVKEEDSENRLYYHEVDENGDVGAWCSARKIDDHYILRSDIVQTQDGSLTRAISGEDFGVVHTRKEARSKLEKLGNQWISYLNQFSDHPLGPDNDPLR